MTKRNLLIVLLLLGCLIPIICLLGYLEVIRNGLLLSSLIKVLLLCIFAIAGLYLFKFKSFDRFMIVAIIVAFACTFAIVAK